MALGTYLYMDSGWFVLRPYGLSSLVKCVVFHRQCERASDKYIGVNQHISKNETSPVCHNCGKKIPDKVINNAVMSEKLQYFNSVY